MKQLFGSTLRVGAQIEHIRVRAASRHGPHDCGTIDPGQRLEDEASGCHECTGIARADTGVGLSRLDEVDRHTHRRVFLAPERLARRFVHAHDFFRMMHA